MKTRKMTMAFGTLGLMLLFASSAFAIGTMTIKDDTASTARYQVSSLNGALKYYSYMQNYFTGRLSTLQQQNAHPGMIAYVQRSLTFYNNMVNATSTRMVVLTNALSQVTAS